VLRVNWQLINSR